MAPVRARSQTKVVAWHDVEGIARHDDHDMDGDPRKMMLPRSPKSPKDRQHPNGVGQSKKPDGSLGMA